MREHFEKSRLKKHLQKEATRNVIFAIFGGILLLLFILLFGTKILIGFSLMVEKLFGAEEPTRVEQQNITYIAPPTLNPTAEATSSASIVITGYGSVPNQRIDLYRNGKILGKTTTKSNNTFRFTNVTLVEGVNSMRVRAVTSDNKRSDYSNELKISMLNTSPDLSVETPQDDQGFKKEQSPIRVTGKTNPGVVITVNDFRAIVDSSGSFNYRYTLKDGDNTLKIVATDVAGNQTTKELKIRIE